VCQVWSKYSQSFIRPQPVLYRRQYVFAMSVPSSVRPVFRPVPNIYISLRKNTERISIKFAGDNCYHQQFKWLHFVRIWNRNKGAGYKTKFESTSIGFAAMSNGCWRLANEFTNSLHRLPQIRLRTQFHVNLQDFAYKFHIKILRILH